MPLMDSVGYHTCLHWRKTFTEITESGLVGTGRYTITHELRQINDVAAVDVYNKIYIPVYSAEGMVKVLARVIKNGKEIFSADQDDMKTVEEQEIEFKLLALEGVDPGCYVETIIIMIGEVDFSGEEFLQDDIPIKELSVAVIVPDMFTLKHKVYNSQAEVRETKKDERYMISTVLSNVAPFQEEAYCNTNARMARIQYGLKEVVETGAKGMKWADIGRRYFENTFANYDKSKSGVKKLLKEMGVDKTSDTQEKIFVIENYLKENIQVVRGIATEDIATTVLKNHASSPFGFNRLMAFCFRDAGINFEFVGTCSRNNKLFDKDFDSELFFTDMIFYFPEIDMYLSPQDPELRIPLYSNEFYNQDCIRIKQVELGGVFSPVITTKTIPANKMEDAEIMENYVVVFESGNSSTTTSYSRAFEGPADQGIRALYYYTDEETKEEFIKDFIKSGQPNAEVSEVVVKNTNLSNFNEFHSPLEISATMKGSDLLEFAGDKVIFKIGNVIGEQSELYNTKPRQNGVDVEFQHVYRRTLTINIPEGYQLKGLEDLKIHHEAKTGDVATSFFTSDYALNGSTLVVTITEMYGDITYPFEKYNEFAAVVNAAADFNKATLLLEKKN